MRGLIIVLACGACGDDTSRHIDDARIDGPAQADAAHDATPSGDIAITTLVRCCDVTAGTPQMGVTVVAVQPDGSVGDHGQTDAQGTLTLHGVVSGAVVTAVYPETAMFQTRVTSVFAVEPGDYLTFGDQHFVGGAGGGSGFQTIDVPALAGATEYDAYTPCSAGTATPPATAITVAQYTYCQTPTTPLVAVAFDDSFNLVASTYAATADDSVNGTVDLGAWTANTQSNYMVSIAGLDAQTSFVSLEGAAWYPAQHFGGVASPTITAGSASALVTIPVTAPRTFGHARIQRIGEFGDQHAYMVGTATSATLAPPTLPWVGGLVVNGVIGRAVWLQTTGPYDAAVLDVTWNRFDVSETEHFYDWSVILPPGVTALDFSAPPALLAPYMPGVMDSVVAQLQLVDLASAPDYDAARGVIDWQLEHPDAAVTNGDQTGASFAQNFAQAGL